MNAETFFKINELSKQLALTNEQLQEYLLLNGIDLYNNMDVDFSDKKFIKLIDKQKINIIMIINLDYNLLE